MTFNDILQKISDREHLLPSEATFALSEILTGNVPDVQISAFLFGMRSKGETIAELTAFVQTMRAEAVKVNVDTTGAVDLCGTGGDHSGTFNISTAAMFVTAGAGVPVLKHGNRSISSNSGSYDVLEQLGAEPSLPGDAVEKCFNETGMAFMFAPLFHPAMKYVMPARKGLGMRTFFNILGPLLNPANVKRQVIGAYNKDVAHQMVRILANLDTDYAITLHAHDGLDEVSTTALTDTFELKNKVSSDAVRFDASELGYKLATIDDLQGGESVENARIIRSIFENKAPKPHREIVELNATFGIFASGKVSSLKDAQRLAAESIDSGAALKAVRLFAACTKDLSASKV
jgi:anthranilate phosphoribosyltransferase